MSFIEIETYYCYTRLAQCAIEVLVLKHKNSSLFGLKFIDLFAGLGGFRIALESCGASSVYSSECDKSAKEIYKINFAEIPDDDITLVNENAIPDHDILCAGFPCQAFSISGKQKGFKDSRGTLFFDVARIAKAKKPKVLFLENVKNFATHDNGNTLKVVKETLSDIGYNFFSDVLNSQDFGIPQNRERIYIVCFRKDLGINKFIFPKAFNLSVCLENLLLPDDEVSNLVINRSDLILKKNHINDDITKPIRIGTVGKGGQGERIYSPKGIAITLSSNGGGAFAKTGGYLINGKTRRLHPRECARLMGFPDSYLIHPSSNQAYKQFGNSVVIDVLQYIAINIGTTLHEHSSI